MDDQAIIGLYCDRSEQAISETAVKYGKYCFGIAFNILSNKEDSEESVNDTYLAAWNNIPPWRPSVLSTFLGKLTRNISLNRWKSRRVYKRGGDEVTLALDELGDCISTGESTEDVFEKKELARSVGRFVAGLGDTERRVFIRRYWYLDSVQDIADSFGYSQSKAASMLHRIRGKLRKHLEKEGLS